MSSKLQSEYLRQLEDLRLDGKRDKAAKLIYQWIKTDKLKQSTLLEFMGSK